MKRGRLGSNVCKISQRICISSLRPFIWDTKRKAREQLVLAFDLFKTWILCAYSLGEMLGWGEVGQGRV